MTETRGTIDACAIATVSDADACAYVDEVLGEASSWPSRLVSYRLSSDFQISWKREVGRWLRFARDTGFLPTILPRIERARSVNDPPLADGKPDPNDRAHRILNQELAEVRVAYYLCAAGWSFLSVPEPGNGYDVDLRMKTPRGLVADVQVKASDRLGRIVGSGRVDGENDGHVTAGLKKAIQQLARSPGPIRIAVTCPQRAWPMSRESGKVAACVLGRTNQLDGGIPTLDRKDRGLFAKVDGRRVHAAVVLDLVRLAGIDPLYSCTVFLNPWAIDGPKLSPDDFPHAAVCELVSDTFRWRGNPGHNYVVPDGTMYRAREMTPDTDV